jgi:hypothetical protein
LISVSGSGTSADPSSMCTMSRRGTWTMSLTDTTVIHHCKKDDDPTLIMLGSGLNHHSFQYFFHTHIYMFSCPCHVCGPHGFICLSASLSDEGSGGVGKSTVSRHMRMTAGGKLSPIEKQNALKAMVGALVSITDNLCQKLLDQDTEGIEMIPESTMDMIEFVHDCCSSNEHDEILSFIQRSDDSDAQKNHTHQKTKLQQCLKELWRLYSKEFEELNKTVSSEDMMKIEGAEICLHHLDHVFTKGFTLPNDEDYLKIRNPTTHMEKHAGVYNGEKFELIDVGGQTHFQHEWGSIIVGVRSETICILYVVSLLDYSWNESRLGLESTINRFDRSLETWRQLLDSEAIAGGAFK